MKNMMSMTVRELFQDHFEAFSFMIFTVKFFSLKPQDIG